MRIAQRFSRKRCCTLLRLRVHAKPTILSYNLNARRTHKSDCASTALRPTPRRATCAINERGRSPGEFTLKEWAACSSNYYSVGLLENQSSARFQRERTSCSCLQGQQRLQHARIHVSLLLIVLRVYYIWFIRLELYYYSGFMSVKDVCKCIMAKYTIVAL